MIGERRYVLVPGRHHLFTTFQWQELGPVEWGETNVVVVARKPSGRVV
jgi:hypothetical protein